MTSRFDPLPALLALGFVLGCATERPLPCLPGSCGTVSDRDATTFVPDLPAASDAGDAATRTDLVSALPADAAPEAPRTSPRADLGTRGLIASLPCSDVLRALEVSVVPRPVPPNSFQLRVRNGSATETLSVWYNATLNTDWNIENLASELRPGQEVSLDFWRSTGTPAWYVLGINRVDHYAVNRDGVFVELPCGAAARGTTQRFRANIEP